MSIKKNMKLDNNGFKDNNKSEEQSNYSENSINSFELDETTFVKEEKPKILVKTKSNYSSVKKGYVDVVVLFLIISFAVAILMMIIYFILN